ncbi:MAG: hypothetical protein ACREQI_00930 [Candidatus Binataceae bacterium]
MPVDKKDVENLIDAINNNTAALLTVALSIRSGAAGTASTQTNDGSREGTISDFNWVIKTDLLSHP